VVARERRVVTPDGRVWYVRRRWARRRWPWARDAGRAGARFADEGELREGDPPLPLIEDTFTTARSVDDLLDRFQDQRHVAGRMVPAVIVGFMVSAIVVGAFIEYGVPFLVANAKAVVGVAAGVAVVVALDRWQRPWFVELQRQGLADAPRRVWRVRGWRRSGRLMGEIAAAVREGGIDTEHAVVLLRGRDRRLPR
jgi:hypothetical protein